MDNNVSHDKNENYNEAAGLPKGVPSVYDFYRYKKVKKYLYGKSVLDIGPGRADFLDIIKSEYEISGIDMNMERVKYCNEKLHQDAVRLGNLQQGLDFKDNSFDTVTCMEVIEHLTNPREAVRELVRVSRKRVIITVPFNEKLQYVLCIHCAKYTPLSGHLHSFNNENIKDLIPQDARITKSELIGNNALKLLPYLDAAILKLPIGFASSIDNLLNRILPRARWMMIILEKEK